MPSGPLLLRASPYDSMPGVPLLLKSYVKQQNQTNYSPWKRADSLQLSMTAEESFAKIDDAIERLDKIQGLSVPQVKAPSHLPMRPPLRQRQERPKSAAQFRSKSTTRDRPQSAILRTRRPQSANPISQRQPSLRPGKKIFTNLPKYNYNKNIGRKLASDDFLRESIRGDISRRVKMSKNGIRVVI